MITLRYNYQLLYGLGSAFVLSILSFPVAQASPRPPLVTKVSRSSTVATTFNYFGSSAALSNSYAVIGEVGNSDVGSGAGAVHLFNAATGAFVRKLVSPDRLAGGKFGCSVAACGSLVLVGAYGNATNTGAAYLFDGTTGRLLRKLTASDGATEGWFGFSVSLSGNYALVGAPQHTAPASGVATGAAYLFDVTTGVQLAKLLAIDRVSGDLFGVSVSLSGELALVGASNKDSFRGTAYLFDARSTTQLKRFNAPVRTANDYYGRSVSLFGSLAAVGAEGDSSFKGAAYVIDYRNTDEGYKVTASDGAAGQYFGRSVALSHNQLLVGRSSGGGGAVYLYSALTGLEWDSFIPADSQTGDQFGQSVALNGTTAVVGAIADDDRGFDNGSAYLLRKLHLQQPLALVAQFGEVAPGVSPSKFRTPSPPVISGNGPSAFISTLTGTGAGVGNVAKALWYRDDIGNQTFLARGSTALGGGVSIASVDKPVFNDDFTVICQGTLKGDGISTLNDAALFYSTGGLPTVMLQENGIFTGFADTKVGSFLQVVQDYALTGNVAAAIKRKSGSRVVTAANDTGIIRMDETGGHLGGFGEGDVSTVGLDVRWGQMAPRVAIMNTGMIWNTALVAGPATPPGTITTATNQAVCNNSGVIARSGDSVAVNTNYRTFLGESYSNDNQATFRVTLTGDGVTTSTNEGIYRFGLGQAARKGDLVDPALLPNVKISRIVRYWSLKNGQVMLSVVLTGPGVSTATDQALLLANPYDRYYILLREGDRIASADRAKVGVIQKVDVDPVRSSYIVLATLVSAADNNLALFTGGLIRPPATVLHPRLTRATLFMRKGLEYRNTFDADIVHKISSMSINAGVDAQGTGCKGLATSVSNSGFISLGLSYTNGTKQSRAGAFFAQPPP
jgi:hypothetical protein